MSLRPPPTLEAERHETLTPDRRQGVATAMRGHLRDLWRDKAGLFGILVVLGLVLLAVFAPLIAPYDPSAQSLTNRLAPPFWEAGGSLRHVLGTDNLGRDVLSRIIFGSRISLIVGVSVVLVASAIGTVLGLIAGYFGGRVDNWIMGVLDTQAAFPGLLLILVALQVLGPSATSIIIMLGLNGWMVYARLVRGVVLSLRETDYVEAAEIIGCRRTRVVLRHMLPNLTSPLLTLAILEFARIVLAEAALSFLGAGIQPPQVSWGLMVADGKAYIFSAWWLVTFPGAAIALTVLGVNLLASWLRVAMDPQEREKRFAATASAGAMGSVV